MMDIDINAVRQRAEHYLGSADVAAHAGLTVAQLQSFVSGQYSALGGGSLDLSPDKLLRLARRIGCICDER
jgi:hypothetical protein